MRPRRPCCWARSWASGIAVLLGFGFYRGASRVNLRTFFRWTGIALIFIAAGLLSYAVHEFVEIGWITDRHPDRCSTPRRPCRTRRSTVPRAGSC